MFENEIAVLVVEDNRHDRELISQALTSYGLAKNVIAVSSGSEALDFIHARGRFSSPSRPALAIVDLNLPDAHGLELLKEIRSHNDLANLPVVILTGSHSAIDAAAARQLGANAYVVKPTTWEDLQKLVRSAVAFWATPQTA